MRINGNRRDSRDSYNVDGSMMHIEDYLDENIDNKAAEAAVTKSPVKSRKMKKSRFYKCHLDRSIRAKKKGVRQARRVENTNYLLCQSEQDDPETGDFEYVELMEHGLTPFTALFDEEENMQIWYDFINQSEDDQRELLCKLSLQSHDTRDEDDDVYEGHDSASFWQDCADSRVIHPAYSAEECFQRIDSRLKSLLRRRHLPLGMLMDLEEEVSSFFMEWPQSVYVCQLENSFERMLLHALCQYLGLHSSSYDNKAGHRQTQVENLNQHFIVPTMMLCDYIVRQRTKH